MQYIAIIISAVALLLNDYVNFLSKSLAGAILGILVLALLHVVIKDAVVEAIKEARE